jgi:cell growth-regulating nucleolar protein
VFDYLVTDGKDGPSQVNTPKDDEFMTDEDDDDDEQWEDTDDVFMDPPPDYYAETPYNAQRDFDEHGYSYGAEPIRQFQQRYDSNPHLPTNPMAYLISRDDDDTDTDPGDTLKTPAPNHANTAAKSHHERTLSGDSTTKKSGKRKRSQPEDLDLSRIRAYTGDVVMTDATTPSLHSGLTVGLSRMMMVRSATGGFPFPPSPDDSIGDLEGEEKEALEPRSPLKRTKHSGSKERGRSREKGREKRDREREHRRAKKSRRESDQSRKHGRWERRRPRGRSESPPKEKEPTSLIGKALKAIDYHPVSSTGPRPAARDEPKPHDGNAVILHSSTATSRAETFMSFVARTSLVENNERGCSVHKALRRWHREKGGSSKTQDEKELWRDLRLRVNDRGEIVLFAD